MVKRKGIKKLTSLLVVAALTLAGSVVAFAEVPADVATSDVSISLTLDNVAITDPSTPDTHVAVISDWTRTNDVSNKQLFCQGGFNSV